MARTLSNMLKVGTVAPDFSLLDTVSDKEMNLQEIKGNKATVVLFICNHCPFVIHVNSLLVSLANEYKEKEVNFVAISSNDVENYPQDAPHLMKIHAESNKYPFPYLYDETQNVAKAYNAVCTPDIYVFDGALKAYYRGQLDDSRPGNGILTTGKDIKKVLNTLLDEKPYEDNIKPSIGCSIKWK